MQRDAVGSCGLPARCLSISRDCSRIVDRLHSRDNWGPAGHRNRGSNYETPTHGLRTSCGYSSRGGFAGQELLQHTRVPVLTKVLAGVEEDEQNDDRPRPDRVAVVPPPEDRVQNDETRRDDQARHGQLEEQPLAPDGPPRERFFGLGHGMKCIRAGGVSRNSRSRSGWAARSEGRQGGTGRARIFEPLGLGQQALPEVVEEDGTEQHRDVREDLCPATTTLSHPSCVPLEWASCRLHG
jgi:hypothetical protein